MIEKVIMLFINNYHECLLVNKKELLANGLTKEDISNLLIKGNLIKKDKEKYQLDYKEIINYLINNNYDFSVFQLMNVFTYFIEFEYYNYAYMVLKKLKNKGLNDCDYKFYLICLSNFIDLDENIDDISLHDILNLDNKDENECRKYIFQLEYELFNKLLKFKKSTRLIKLIIVNIIKRKFNIIECLKCKKYNEALILLNNLDKLTKDEQLLKYYIEKYLEIKQSDNYFSNDFSKIYAAYYKKLLDKKVNYFEDPIYIILNDITNLLRLKNKDNCNDNLKDNCNAGSCEQFSEDNFKLISDKPFNIDLFFCKLDEYLKKINKIEYRSIIIKLLKTSLLANDFTYYRVSYFLKQLSKDKIELDYLIRLLFEAICYNNTQSSYYYFEIIREILEIELYDGSKETNNERFDINEIYYCAKTYKRMLENYALFKIYRLDSTYDTKCLEIFSKIKKTIGYYTIKINNIPYLILKLTKLINNKEDKNNAPNNHVSSTDIYNRLNFLKNKIMTDMVPSLDDLCKVRDIYRQLHSDKLIKIYEFIIEHYDEIFNSKLEKQRIIQRNN